ncbi:hypothetical protein KKA53_00685 [Candidatus Dependentiae bacterium]|nr:hypothetical protein [Candidatus Dependentiae bacterium]
MKSYYKIVTVIILGLTFGGVGSSNAMGKRVPVDEVLKLINGVDSEYDKKNESFKELEKQVQALLLQLSAREKDLEQIKSFVANDIANLIPDEFKNGEGIGEDQQEKTGAELLMTYVKSLAEAYNLLEKDHDMVVKRLTEVFEKVTNQK